MCLSHREVDRAIAGPGPQQVQVPQQALLPPLREFAAQLAEALLDQIGLSHHV